MKSDITARLKTLWESRSPKDRKIMIVLSTVLSIIFYLLFVHGAEKSRSALRANVTSLRIQSASLDEQATEYQQLRNLPSITISSTDLRTLVQTQVDTAGLAPAMQHIETLSSNRVTATFAAISFADWLRWVVDLNAQHIRVASCRIEALSTSGLVNVSVTLVRPSPANL